MEDVRRSHNICTSDRVRHRKIQTHVRKIRASPSLVQRQKTYGRKCVRRGKYVHYRKVYVVEMYIREEGAHVVGSYVRHGKAYVVAEVTRIRIPNLHHRKCSWNLPHGKRSWNTALRLDVRRT